MTRPYPHLTYNCLAPLRSGMGSAREHHLRFASRKEHLNLSAVDLLRQGVRRPSCSEGMNRHPPVDAASAFVPLGGNQFITEHVATVSHAQGSAWPVRDSYSAGQSSMPNHVG